MSDKFYLEKSSDLDALADSIRLANDTDGPMSIKGSTGIRSFNPFTTLITDTFGAVITSKYGERVLSGEIVAINDISLEKHPIDVKISSKKNLIPCPYNYGDKELYGITWTDNGGGIWTANGTAENHSYICIGRLMLQKGTYTLSGCPKGGSGSTYFIHINIGNTFLIGDYGSGATFTVDEEREIDIWLNVYKDATVSDLYFAPQLESGEVATERIDISKVKLTKTGLNIWNEVWELGSITNQGVNINSTTSIRSGYIPVKGGVKYRIHAPYMTRMVQLDINKTYYNHTYPGVNGSFTPSKDGYVRFAIGKVGETPEVTEYGNNICISVYDEATSGIYEPYKSEVYSVNADGTVNKIPSMVDSINGLTRSNAYKTFLDLVGGNPTRLMSDDLAGVTKIRDRAFYNHSGVYRVHFPNTLTEIGNEAFKECTYLSNISFVETLNLETIGDYAFAGCNLDETSEIRLRSTKLKSIGHGVFEGCNAKNVRIYIKGKPTICADAFKGLTDVSFYVSWSKDEVEGYPWGANNAHAWYDQVYF